MLRFLILSCLFVVSSEGFAQTEFKTFRDAHNAGVKLINAGNLADARAPLEAARKLAKTDAEKLEANRTLTVPYRELQEIEPMQTAAEFIITNSQQAAERSLTRGAMLEFIQRRGKMKSAIEAYEAKLKKSPDDRTLMYILTEAYGRYLKNATRAAELGVKLAEIDKKSGKPQDGMGQAEAARQLVLAKKFKEGAELFEKAAPLDPKTQAWNLKEAAVAWMKSGDKEKALAAAKLSTEAPPEKRSELLTYFWERALADLYLDAGEAATAVTHYEKAIAVCTIDGYLKDSKAKLAKAKAAAGK
jgi:tetratricopeptide (TPR) repeat protein